LSQRDDSPEVWLANLRKAPDGLKDWRAGIRKDIETAMASATEDAKRHVFAGAAFVERQLPARSKMPQALRSWLLDPKLDGLLQHETRRHMAKDLHRYMFAACFATIERYSPKLKLFPPRLLPEHKNMDAESIPFMDRFRVQLWNEPSATVVSHIAKDGHYYIHPDPSQCRSLTVREVARLQTFPDNYFFEGNRTQQYQQIGNAVPPFLARQIAEVVHDFITASLR
jgi:DNA (cytosine-5)-methyltransferase 1